MYSDVLTRSSEKPILAPAAAESREEADTPKPSSCIIIIIITIITIIKTMSSSSSSSSGMEHAEHWHADMAVDRMHE